MNKDIKETLDRLERIDHKEYQTAFEFADSATFDETARCFKERMNMADYITNLQEQVYEQKELINTVIDDLKHFHLIYNEDGKLILSGESILAEIRYFIDKLEGTIPITMTPFEHDMWEKENRIKGENNENN